MPSLAAGGSYALPVEPARYGLKRYGSRIAKRIDDRQNVARKLIGNGSLNIASELARFRNVAGVAEHSTVGLSCRQRSLRPFRDQAPLLLGEGRVKVQH